MASETDGDIKRVSTKNWARSTGFDPVKLFTKVRESPLQGKMIIKKTWLTRKQPFYCVELFFKDVVFVSCLQLFKDDIMYLLTMDKLWKKRKAPLPLDWKQLESQGSCSSFVALL